MKYLPWVRALPFLLVAMFLAAPASAGGNHHGGHGWGHHGGHHHHGWGRHHNHWGFYGYPGGGGFWPGLAVGVLGGYVINDYVTRPVEVAPAPAPMMKYGTSPMDQCAQKYKSFEPATGLFTSQDGGKKICPFLK